jgi:hypothetical protein
MDLDWAEEKVGEGGNGIAFAAAPPELVSDIVPRPCTHANCNDSQGSHFCNHDDDDDDDDPRDRYWKKNHTVNSNEQCMGDTSGTPVPSHSTTHHGVSQNLKPDLQFIHH